MANNMRKLIPITIITLCILIACTNMEATPTVAPPMDNFTLTPGFTPSATILPSKSPKPTATITSTLEPSPTIPPATIAAQATLESLRGTFPDLKGRYWSGSVSPYGSWAEISFFKEKVGEILRIIEIKGNKHWDIAYSKYSIQVCQPDCGEHGGSVYIDHWSNDRTHVYLVPHPDWDGPNLWFTTGGSTLIRFNLIDGSWADMNIGQSWSFSGDERYLVYSADDGVHLRTMFGNSEYLIRIPEKFERFGQYVWSPDDTKFAFTATYGDWWEGRPGFSVFLFDTRNLSIRTLLEDDLRFLYPDEWVDDNKIIFLRFFGGSSNEVYFFDLVTNQLTPAPLQ